MASSLHRLPCNGGRSHAKARRRPPAPLLATPSLVTIVRVVACSHARKRPRLRLRRRVPYRGHDGRALTSERRVAVEWLCRSILVPAVTSRCTSYECRTRSRNGFAITLVQEAQLVPDGI